MHSLESLQIRSIKDFYFARYPVTAEKDEPMQEILAIAFFGLAAVIYYVQVSR